MTELTNTKQWKDKLVLDYINLCCVLSLIAKISYLKLLLWRCAPKVWHAILNYETAKMGREKRKARFKDATRRCPMLKELSKKKYPFLDSDLSRMHDELLEKGSFTF